MSHEFHKPYKKNDYYGDFHFFLSKGLYSEANVLCLHTIFRIKKITNINLSMKCIKIKWIDI